MSKINYFKIKNPPIGITGGKLPSFPVTYLLELEQNKFYVGYTTQLESRLDSHFQGKGSSFSKEFKPVRLVAYWAGDFEQDITLQCMKLLGVDNVRGYCWSQKKVTSKYIFDYINQQDIWSNLKNILRRYVKE